MKRFPVVGISAARTRFVRDARMSHPLYPHVLRYVTTGQHRRTGARGRRQGITDPWAHLVEELWG